MDVNARFVQAMTTTDIINRDDKTLPFAFYHPGNDEIQEGHIIWHCGTDASGQIISVMSYQKESEKDRHANVITYDQALETRRILIEHGWRPVKPPKTTFHMSDEHKPRELTRKEKRRLSRKIKKLTKQNPFEGHS